MNPDQKKSNPTRRQFLGKVAQGSGVVMAGAAVLGSAVPAVHDGEDNTIRLALIGCGGRGTGAVGNALNIDDQGPIELYAMADLDEANMEKRLDALKKKYPNKINVSQDRKFLGFDSHKKAIDLLQPGDVALCTTRAYIRPVHVEYAGKRESTSSWRNRFPRTRKVCSACWRPGTWRTQRV